MSDETTKLLARYAAYHPPGTPVPDLPALTAWVFGRYLAISGIRSDLPSVNHLVLRTAQQTFIVMVAAQHLRGGRFHLGRVRECPTCQRRFQRFDANRAASDVLQDQIDEILGCNFSEDGVPERDWEYTHILNAAEDGTLSFDHVVGVPPEAEQTTNP